jgi:glycerophosphoryl diester phosphodiesterase
MNTRIFAHRGASAYAPENTLEAFDLAVKMGADGVELDIHLCRTGEIVVAHDETVNRVSSGSGRIRELSLSELKAFSFNRTHPEYANARIPLLSEVFQLLRPTGLSVNIELKNSIVDYPDLERKVLDEIVRYFDPSRIIFSSFNHHSMLRMKKLAPEIPCGLLYEAVMIRPWEYAKQLGVDAIHPHYSQVLLPGGECAAAQNAGIMVNTWTVNSPEGIDAVLREGADIIITNVPDQALKRANRG